MKYHTVCVPVMEEVYARFDDFKSSSSSEMELNARIYAIKVNVTGP